MPGDLVSVVVPCYNAAPYIQSALQSVLAQREADVADVEIIVVDDASVDDSAARVEAMAAAHPGTIRLIRQRQNRGPAAARNAGIRQATGSLICFLDADDEYAPGFFARCAPPFRKFANLAAIVTEVELVNCPRPVHPLQYEALIGSTAANVIVRTGVVDLIGGFPEAAAFRGKAAGEDIEFKTCLTREFVTRRIGEKYLRYFVDRGGHFGYFLDRTEVVGDRLIFKEATPEEGSAETAAAVRAYRFGFRRRVQAMALCKTPVPANLMVAEVELFEELRARFEDVPGPLQAAEGYALYACAKLAGGDGDAVEIGCAMGRTTCWLAAASKSARRGKIAAIEDFKPAPGRQAGGSHGIEAVANSGTNYLDFENTLRQKDLLDWVEPWIGISREIAGSWSRPIRLLVIGGEQSDEQCRPDFQAWSAFVVPTGVVALHGIEVRPGITRFYRELLAAGRWREVMRAGSLRVVQRAVPARERGS
jgi:glycosyltransferase involved in cell wall biosynthesis